MGQKLLFGPYVELNSKDHEDPSKVISRTINEKRNERDQDPNRGKDGEIRFGLCYFFKIMYILAKPFTMVIDYYFS